MKGRHRCPGCERSTYGSEWDGAWCVLCAFCVRVLHGEGVR